MLDYLADKNPWIAFFRKYRVSQNRCNALIWLYILHQVIWVLKKQSYHFRKIKPDDKGINWLTLRSTWKTKFLGTSSEGCFRTLSDRISHRFHIVRTSCSQLPGKSGIIYFFVEVVYWLCGLKFVYSMINLAFLGIIVKLKLPAKFCLHSFEWFCLKKSSDAKYFSSLI